MLKVASLLCVLCFLAGCTHQQLRHNTVNQSQTLTDIYQQQVLDNLAMFSQDPFAVPHFVIPTSGGSDVSDKGGVSSNFNAFRRDIGGGVDRTMKEAWTLQPITDPSKLRRMRCAYQRAVGFADDQCSNCCELRKEFLGKADKVVPLFSEEGDVLINPESEAPYPGTVDWATKDVFDAKTNRRIPGETALVYEPLIEEPSKLDWGTHLVKRRAYVRTDSGEIFPAIGDDGKDLFVHVLEETHGRVQSVSFPRFNCDGPCEVHSCWFETCQKRCPSHWNQSYVGKYRHRSVYVPPSGRDELGALVLEIMDYALKEPTVKPIPQKEVTLYLDAEGKPSDPHKAFQVVKALLPLDKKNSAVADGKIVTKVSEEGTPIFNTNFDENEAAKEVIDSAPQYEIQSIPRVRDYREFELYRQFQLGN